MTQELNPCEVTHEDIAAARECLAAEYAKSNFMAFAGTPGGITYRRDEAALHAMLAFRDRQSAQTSQPTPVADEGRREAMSVAEAKLLALVSTMHTAWMEREDAMTRPYTDHFVAIERMADLMDQIVDKVPELRRLTDAILATELATQTSQPECLADDVEPWTVRVTDEISEMGGPVREVLLPNGEWRGVIAVDAEDARDTIRDEWLAEQADADKLKPPPEYAAMPLASRGVDREAVARMRKMRADTGISAAKLARAFGVSTMTAHRVIKGDTWK